MEIATGQNTCLLIIMDLFDMNMQDMVDINDFEEQVRELLEEAGNNISEPLE